MAKARDIAALAGLAGLAYANRDKLFGGKKTYNEDAGKQETSSYTGGNKKVSASDDRMSNEEYIKSRMKTAPVDAKGSVQSDVVKALTAPRVLPNDQAGNQGVLPSKSLTPKVKPKTKLRGMTPKQHDMLATANLNQLTDEKINQGRRMASGGMTASRRADGIATKGKTRGKIC